MQTIQINTNIRYGSKGYSLDQKGFLLDIQQWDKNFVQYFVEESQKPNGQEYVGQLENGQLTGSHWFVIYVFRAYYKKFGMVPETRILSKITGMILKELFELFPVGPIWGGSRIAGLPYSIASACTQGTQGTEILSAKIVDGLREKYL